MRIKILSFSPTGGTLKVAKTLANVISEEFLIIDFTSRFLVPFSLEEDEVAIIATPSYSGRIPPLAVQRLRKVTGNGARAIVVAVYGNRAYDDTLVELGDLATELGFKVIAGVAAVSKHSIVTKIATNRPDYEDLEKLKEFGEKIKEKLDNEDLDGPFLPGNRPYRRGGKGIKPKTNDSCMDCGKCANECPTGAIATDNPRNLDSKLCIRCMRCVSICPNHAKYVPKLKLFIAEKMIEKACAERKEPELYL